ncbi:MAG: glycosyltransferase family 2 protein [Actinobacteria bacterium]|nr:glycosyltransferase family 2 protein [Actinomycetota bacterium]
MEASIIVPLQGGAEQARRCFEALAGLDASPRHEVIVVDDASADLSALLSRLDGDVSVVRLERRAGLAAAVARGAQLAQGRILVVVRDACEVQDGWLAELLAPFADEQTAATTSVVDGAGATHPVAAPAFALRREELDAWHECCDVPEGLELAALVATLSARGRLVVPVAASRVAAAGTRRVGARGMPGEPPELSVVIPTLDAASGRVRACVAAVHATVDVASEIVLIDNGGAPQGFTAPVNAGLRAARGRYVVVMNDDVETLPGWWPPLREALDAGTSVAFPLTIDGAMRTDFAAWCFAVSRRGLERFAHAPDEFFDPALRVWFQDSDLLLRLRAAGCPPRLVREARIRHGLSETVATDDPILRGWIDREIAGDLRRFDAKHPGAASVIDGRVVMA